jgi:hypothetical protein
VWKKSWRDDTPTRYFRKSPKGNTSFLFTSVGKMTSLRTLLWCSSYHRLQVISTSIWRRIIVSGVERKINPQPSPTECRSVVQGTVSQRKIKQSAKFKLVKNRNVRVVTARNNSLLNVQTNTVRPYKTFQAQQRAIFRGFDYGSQRAHFIAFTTISHIIQSHWMYMGYSKGLGHITKRFL